MKYNKDSIKSYLAIKCEKRSIAGFRFDFGISKYFYNNKTEQWLGNHGGPNFNFILTINKLNFGFRFKPWTVNPKSLLVFNNDTLPKYANINPVKLDYYVGYSFDFDYNISIEPFLGFSTTTFSVINEVELKKTYTIPNANGLISGITFNKYFHYKDYEYLAVFASFGYAFVDYEKVNKNLGMGYFELTIGVAYKGFIKRQFLRKVN